MTDVSREEFNIIPDQSMHKSLAARLVEEARSLWLEASNAPAGEQEVIARKAVEAEVDAFLLDRKGQTLSFKRAHVLGGYLARRFGCFYATADGGETWKNPCGVLGLHSRIGMSYGATTKGRCSVCDAEDLMCSHVPGIEYEGQRCVRMIYEVSIHEISVVQFPDDPRCYRIWPSYPRAEFEKAFGGPLPEGVAPVCTHCVNCYGALDGAAQVDVDQSLWSPKSLGDGE